MYIYIHSFCNYRTIWGNSILLIYCMYVYVLTLGLFSTYCLRITWNLGSFREKWKNRILMKMPTSWAIFLFYSMLFHHIPSSTSSKGKKPSNSSPHQVSDVQASSFGLWVGLSIPFFWDFRLQAGSGSAKFASDLLLGGYMYLEEHKAFRGFY